MKKIIITTATILALSSCTQEKPDADITQLSQEAMGIVQEFGGSLKPQLKAAMKAGGPVNAISVCKVQAPAISTHLNNKHKDWDIKRVSLKNRNPNATPDAWEAKVLKEFDKQAASGEDIKTMKFAEIVDGKFRMMKAQGVEPVCLHCHGTNIKADVNSKLKELYPHDKATGYQLKQVRGAFSLSKDI